MTILEMHNVFRSKATRVGMHSSIVILPTHIDDFLNDAIDEYVRENLTIQIKEFDNGVDTTTLNNIRTLYREKELVFDKTYKGHDKFKLDIPDVAYYLGFSVKYNKLNMYCDCRLIERTDLGKTLNDYLNRPTYDNPIASMSNIQGVDMVDVYGDNRVIPSKLIVKFIKKPIKVIYDDNPDYRVNCDLPDIIHGVILENAVSKFKQSIKQ